MSTTIANLAPVPVSQPHILSLSSTFCRHPKSWSTRFLSRALSSNISREELRRSEKFRYAEGLATCGGNRDMWRGLSYVRTTVRMDSFTNGFEALRDGVLTCFPITPIQAIAGVNVILLPGSQEKCPVGRLRKPVQVTDLVASWYQAFLLGRGAGRALFF